MIAFSLYLLKVIVFSAVLFGYYWFLLRDRIFHDYNRFYLLTALVLSLTLPMVKFTIWRHAEAQDTGIVHMLQVVNSSDEYITEIMTQVPQQVDKEQLAAICFIFVCLFFVVLFLKTLSGIYSLKNNNPTEKYDGITLIQTDDESTPFSFFNNIFWNKAIDIRSNNGSRILKHELAHVKELHSHDKIFVNIVLIFFWCNPIFWLLRKELNMIHEFTADKKAVVDGDTTAFAAMILAAFYPSQQFGLTNNFFYSPIKRRLAMLTKNKKNVTYFSRILVLPLSIILFAAFTIKTKLSSGEHVTHKTITVVLDAGHGGTDNGATGIDGTLEKDIALTLAKRIKELNSDKFINIILLRETDVYISPQEKAIMAKKLGAEIFISLHVDSGPGTDQTTHSGITLWVKKDEFANVQDSKFLASALIGSFKKNYPLPVADMPMQRKMGIWVLQASECPAVIIESGFMNNKKDRTFIKSAAGQDQFANRVLEGIYDFAADKLVDNGSVENTAIMPDHAAQKQNITEVFADTIKIKMDGSKNGKQKFLYIINGMVYQSADLKNKEITAKKARVYEAGNKKMIALYGAQAANGVMILEGAVITNDKDSKAADKVKKAISKVDAAPSKSIKTLKRLLFCLKQCPLNLKTTVTRSY